MANRHLSRSIVLQTLFEWDFNGRDNSKLKEILNKNIEEFGPGLTDFSFMEKTVEGIINKVDDIDKIIVESAPDWPLERISVIDRNVLRVGLYELLFADRKEVPAKVAINESIELAKNFGGETSGKFINGVLGTVYKEIGEPGKEEATNKNDDKDDDPSKYPVDKLIGVVVFSKENNKTAFAMVHDVFGYWTLCKGKMLLDEKTEDAAKRKVLEEINLEVIKTEESLGGSEYVASDPERGKVKKQVSYVLAEAKKSPLKLKETGGLDNARWFSMEEVAELNMYDDITAVITEAIKIISKK